MFRHRIRESENKKRSGERGICGPQLQLPNDAQRLPNYSDYRCIYVFSSADSAALLDNLLSRSAGKSRIDRTNKT